MNPSDFDDGGEDGLSFNDLPPSMRRRALGASLPTTRTPSGMDFGPAMTMPGVMQAVAAPSLNTQSPTFRTTAPTSGQGSAVQNPPTGALAPIPVQQYRQQQPIQQVVAPGQQGAASQQMAQPGADMPTPADSSPWLFIGATAILGALGWWAYSKMEKEKKVRVGPPQLGRGRSRDDLDDGFGDDGDDYDDDDVDEKKSRGPLDAYARVRKPKKMVDPHEEGGIKLVKG